MICLTTIGAKAQTNTYISSYNYKEINTNGLHNYTAKGIYLYNIAGNTTQKKGKIIIQ